MTAWRWLPRRAVVAMYRELLVEHGGLPGPANAHCLESTLARPRQLAHYDRPGPDAARLAACYGFGLARNHCFPDGNKRLALVAIDVFLRLNGFELTVGEVEAVGVILALAAGELDEPALAEWVREHMQALNAESD